MNVEQMYALLDKCLLQLNAAGVDDNAKLDLELLAIQLKRQIRLGVLDPLQDLDSITSVNLSRLTPLIAQVSDEIHNEERRVELVNKIVLLAKMGLQSAGLPMLS